MDLSLLGVAVRRCYVSDIVVKERAEATGASEEELIKAKLPDAGSTMSGDFGEILVDFYQAAKTLPKAAIGPRKWRLKQDRTKPAPYSDVVHFVLPSWPSPGPDDLLLCSEVKSKATAGNFAPIRKRSRTAERTGPVASQDARSVTRACAVRACGGEKSVRGYHAARAYR